MHMVDVGEEEKMDTLLPRRGSYLIIHLESKTGYVSHAITRTGEGWEEWNGRGSELS